MAQQIQLLLETLEPHTGFPDAPFTAQFPANTPGKAAAFRPAAYVEAQDEVSSYRIWPGETTGEWTRKQNISPSLSIFKKKILKKKKKRPTFVGPNLSFGTLSV